MPATPIIYHNYQYFASIKNQNIPIFYRHFFQFLFRLFYHFRWYPEQNLIFRQNGRRSVFPGNRQVPDWEYGTIGSYRRQQIPFTGAWEQIGKSDVSRPGPSGMPAPTSTMIDGPYRRRGQAPALRSRNQSVLSIWGGAFQRRDTQVPPYEPRRQSIRECRAAPVCAAVRCGVTITGVFRRTRTGGGGKPPPYAVGTNRFYPYGAVRKFDGAACGPMWASAPTGRLRINKPFQQMHSRRG